LYQALYPPPPRPSFLTKVSFSDPCSLGRFPRFAADCSGVPLYSGPFLPFPPMLSHSAAGTVFDVLPPVCFCRPCPFFFVSVFFPPSLSGPVIPVIEITFLSQVCSLGQRVVRAHVARVLFLPDGIDVSLRGYGKFLFPFSLTSCHWLFSLPPPLQEVLLP